MPTLTRSSKLVLQFDTKIEKKIHNLARERRERLRVDNDPPSQERTLHE